MRLMRDRTVSPQAFSFLPAPYLLTNPSFMYICYVDESGVDQIGAGTSHFVYLGLAVPAETWKAKDKQVSGILGNYDLAGEEIHTGWLLRRYLEQERVADFGKMDSQARRKAVEAERNAWLLRTAALKSKSQLESLKKTLRKTQAYVHLRLGQRLQLVRDLADMVGGWIDSRLFAECCDKNTYGQQGPQKPIYESAFTQMVQRFQAFLTHKGDYDKQELLGMLVHDNNQTISLKLTDMMRRFHASGTLRWEIDKIIETPLFVDSRLTAMIQVADLCAYATRRFFENGETDLFNRIYGRFDRTGARVVGIRHYRHNRSHCPCRVCVDHVRQTT